MRMKRICFGMAIARSSGRFGVVDSHSALTDLVLLGRYRDGLGRFVIQSSTVNTMVPSLKSV